ncbi:SPW repeat protein [Candidatus Poribacteria bacterium]|nr:SPW repeat protein [Candidatus Poribacteria bacterium]
MNWINVVLGLWMFISGFISGIVHNRTGALINDLAVGVLVAVFGILTAVRRWPQWINVAIGIWLIVAALAIPSASTAAWNNLVFGILILIFGSWASLMPA